MKGYLRAAQGEKGYVYVDSFTETGQRKNKLDTSKHRTGERIKRQIRIYC